MRIAMNILVMKKEVQTKPSRLDILLALIIADNHIPIFIIKKLTTTPPMIINRITLALVTGVIRIIRNVRAIRVNRVFILQWVVSDFLETFVG
jgi:hypothetical protein